MLSSAVARSTSLPPQALVGCHHSFDTRPPPLELDCLLVAIIAYLQVPPLIPRPYRIVKCCCRFFRARGPAGHHRALSSPTAHSTTTSRARLFAGCPHHLFHVPLPLFQPTSSLLPPLSVLSSTAAGSVPPPLPLEPDYSLVITATSCRASQLVQCHHRLFSSPIARSTLSPVPRPCCVLSSTAAFFELECLSVIPARLVHWRHDLPVGDTCFYIILTSWLPQEWTYEPASK